MKVYELPIIQDSLVVPAIKKESIRALFFIKFSHFCDMIIAMKRIRLHTFSISYCIIGFLLPTLGILLLNNVNYLVISGSAFIFAITLIHIHMSRQEHISDLILEPEKILIIYRKFNKISKEIPISINDIKEHIIYLKCNIIITFFYTKISIKRISIKINIYLKRESVTNIRV